MLDLAASASNLHRLTMPMATVEKRSATCGSRIIVDVAVDSSGRITEIGMSVHACILGQTSAALMNAEALGRSAADVAAAGIDLAAWLSGNCAVPPDWPGIEVLTAAKPHHARHASIRLAFEATAEAADLAAHGLNRLSG